jgi:hypothetical protein
MLRSRYGQGIDSQKLRKLGYGLEAIKRFRAGRAIIYNIGKIIVEEHPDGRRFEMTLDEEYRPLRVRELDPRPDLAD